MVALTGHVREDTHLHELLSLPHNPAESAATTQSESLQE